MRRTFALTVALALVAALLIPQVAEAATSLNQVFDNLRNWAMGLLVTVAVLFLTIAGVRYVASGGNPGEIEKAKSALKASLVGFALASLAPVLVAVIQHIVG
jgi:succinate dehydrogenase/fumarate reductase cytochrome b subunit